MLSVTVQKSSIIIIVVVIIIIIIIIFYNNVIGGCNDSLVITVGDLCGKKAVVGLIEAFVNEILD